MIRNSKLDKNVELPVQRLSGKYEKARYETFDMPNNQNQWAFRKSFRDSEKPVKGNGVIYYYYVMKRVR